MALEDLLISTGVDQLIKLIKERGKVELAAAAKELRQPVRSIEDWAHVLEDESLISVEYKLTKTYLVWHGPSAQYAEEKKAEIRGEAAGAKEDVERLLAKVQEGGAELAAMQRELSDAEGLVPLPKEEAARLREDLSDVGAKFSSSMDKAAARLAKLKKELAALEPKVGRAEKSSGTELSRELATLRNFEKSLSEQLDENEAYFEALQARLEEFGKKLAEGGQDDKLAALEAEISEINDARRELESAIEAVSEEQKALSERASKVALKAKAVLEGENSPSALKKKLAELKRIGEDAKRQRDVVSKRLAEALSLAKDESSKAESLLAKRTEAERAFDGIREEYVDICEEISRAQEELSLKKKEADERLSGQLALLEGEPGAAEGRRNQIGKASQLLAEMKREHEELERRLMLLQKESEIFSTPDSGAGAQPPSGGVALSKPVRTQSKEEPREGDNAGKTAAFVERVKLSEEEEGEFARKREELRSLIRRMWEESKGGNGS